MMYIHYCKYCRRIHILNGHKVYCPACSGKLTELGISYMKYVNLSKTERGQLKEKCADEKGLKEHHTIDVSKCIKCGACKDGCPFHAIY